MSKKIHYNIQILKFTALKEVQIFFPFVTLQNQLGVVCLPLIIKLLQKMNSPTTFQRLNFVAKYNFVNVKRRDTFPL